MNIKLRFDVFKRDKFQCVYCGRMPPDVTLEVDHIIPKACGGITYMTLWRWIKIGKVIPLRIGGRPFLTRDQVKFIKNEGHKT